MPGYSGVFVGLTTIDIQFFVEKFPVENCKVKTDPPKIYAGGPATNAAVAFSKLNGSSNLLSSVGKNSFAEIIKNDFDFTNVNHFDLSNNDYISPVIATIITSTEKGNRNVFAHNPPDINTCTSPENIFSELKPEILMIDGFYPEFSLECTKLARKRNIPVVADCGSWKPQYSELLKNTDIVIASSDFFPPDCNNERQVINWLIEKQIKNIAISKGGQNIIFSEDGVEGEITVKETKIVDTLGAGDILHGAFCYYYLMLSNFKLALQNASEIATLSCKFYGTRDWINFTI